MYRSGRDRWTRLVVAGLLGAAAIAGCSSSKRGSGGGAGSSDRGAAASKRQTVTVATQTIQPVITASGKVVPLQIVNLSPKVSGRLIALYVDQGAHVRRGDLIAKMDDQEIMAQMAQTRASLAQAKARLALLRAGNRPEEIAQSKAQVDGAQARMEQSARLKKENESLLAGGFVSADQALAAKTDLRSTAAALEEAQKHYAVIKRGSRPEEIDQAVAQVQEAEANLQAVQVRLNETEIRAPFEGMITQKYASVGAFVTPTTSASGSSSATSTSIVALVGTLEILAKVPEVDIGQLQLGQAAEITCDSFPRVTFHGHVRLIAPEAVIEQNVTSFEARVSLDDGLDRLRSGMSIDAHFAGKAIPDALVVPSVSITTQDKQVGVWVMNATDHQAEFRQVSAGPTTKDKTQILSGVEVGDRVFISQPKERSAPGFNPLRMLGMGGGRRP